MKTCQWYKGDSRHAQTIVVWTLGAVPKHITGKLGDSCIKHEVPCKVFFWVCLILLEVLLWVYGKEVHVHVLLHRLFPSAWKRRRDSVVAKP